METNSVKTPDDIKFELFEDRLYIVLDEPVKKIGSIYTPENKAEPSRLATVKDVGPDVKRYKVGDRVLVSAYTGNDLYLFQYGMLDSRWRILMEREIITKVVKE